MIENVGVLNQPVKSVVESVLEQYPAQPHQLKSDHNDTTSEEGAMMIEIAKGNILEADAEALVNTVNCIGFMGGHRASVQAGVSGELEGV